MDPENHPERTFEFPTPIHHFWRKFGAWRLRKDVVFEQPHEHAQRCVGLLKEKGCEFIVALTHLSLVAWIDLIQLR